MRIVRTLIRIFRIMREGQDIGDAGVLKATLFGRDEGPSSVRDVVLTQRDQNFKKLNVTVLAGLPDGTLGYAYCRFIKQNNLRPLNFSDISKPYFEHYPVMIRYIRLHDLIHVILGFDTSPEGELGVYAFIGKQEVPRMIIRAAQTAIFISRFLFWKRRKMLDAKVRGEQLAETALQLVAQPLETMLDRPLKEVRQSLLGVTDLGHFDL